MEKECKKRLALLEIKTVGDYGFKQIKEDDPNTIAPYYQSQAAIYQALTGHKATVFWYINRDTMASKVVLFRAKPGLWGDMKRKAKVIWSAIHRRSLPDSYNTCTLPNDKAAKTCPFKKICFSKCDMAEYALKGLDRAAEEKRVLRMPKKEDLE